MQVNHKEIIQNISSEFSQVPPGKFLKRRYILIASLFLFVIVLAISPMGDVDSWWHLKTGQLIWEDHSIPSQDPFSFTAHGKDWITHEWLFEVILYGMYMIGGLNLVIILKAVIIGTLFIVLWYICGNHHLNNIVTTILLGLLALLIQGRFSERPQIFSYLFFAMILKILLDYREGGKKRLYFLPVITLLWANIHSAFIFGISLIGLFTILETIVNKKIDKKLWIYSALATVITFANPNGFYSFLYPFKLASNVVFKNVIVELQSPFHPVNQGASFVLVLYVFIALWVSTLIIQIAKKKLDLTTGIISLIFLIITLMASRNRVFFGIATIPFVIRGFKGIPLWTAVVHRKNMSRLYWGLGLFICLIFVFSSLEFIVHGYPLGRGVRQKFALGKEDWVPENTGQFIEKNGLNGNMFNDMGFGGYLIWRLYPNQKVFIDGRNLVYGEDLYRDYWQIIRKHGQYQNLIDKYDIDFFVLKTLPENTNAGTYIHSYLSVNPDWVPLYWDDVSIIYARKNGLNIRIVDDIGFQFIDPIAPNHLQKSVIDESDIEKITSEIKRMLGNSPQSIFANIIAAKIYGDIGDFEKALDRYTVLSKLEPQNPVILRNTGILYTHYRYYTEAQEAFQSALKISPKTPELHALLADVLSQQGKFDDAIDHFEDAMEYGNSTGEILMSLALCYEGKGDDEKAEEYLREIKERFPNSKAAQAAEEYQSISNWKAHMEKAEEFKNQGKIYDAIEEYQMALSYKADDAMTLTMLSNLYWSTENFPKALQMCIKATHVDSTFAGAYNNLGVIYSRMGDAQAARMAWEKAVEIDPQSPAKANLERMAKEDSPEKK